MDVGILFSMHQQFHLHQKFIGVDNCLVETVGETFARSISAICTSLSLSDLFDLYSEFLKFSVSRPDLHLPVANVESALLDRCSREKLPSDFPICDFLSVFRENLNSSILKRIVHLCRTKKDFPRVLLAQELVAIDLAFNDLKIPPTPSFVDAVKNFVIS